MGTRREPPTEVPEQQERQNDSGSRKTPSHLPLILLDVASFWLHQVQQEKWSPRKGDGGVCVSLTVCVSSSAQHLNQLQHLSTGNKYFSADS